MSAILLPVTYRAELPISQRREEIAAHQVVVAGETGRARRRSCQGLPRTRPHPDRAHPAAPALQSALVVRPENPLPVAEGRYV